MQLKKSKDREKKATEDISRLLNQKFVARKRNERGQLKHVATFDHPPSQEELKNYGPGEYSVLTTKPFLKRWARICIDSIKEAQVTASPRSMQKKRKTLSKAKYDPYLVELKERNRKRQKDFEKSKQSESLPVQMPPPPPPRDIIEQSIPEIQKPPNIKKVQNYSAPKSLRLNIDSNQLPNVKIEAKKRVKSKVNPPSKEHIRKIKSRECYRCGHTLISFVRCDFCNGIFCEVKARDCFNDHNCPESLRCYICGRRFPFGEEAIESYCGHAFCCAICQSKCLRKNWENPDCEACIEEYSDTGDEEDENENLCDGYCDTCKVENCEDRCERNGECKHCPENNICPIRCVIAQEYCKKWSCIGFECEERVIELPDKEEMNDFDDEDIDEEEGWDESDED